MLLNADDAVRLAFAHWGARFTAQGVDPADFARVTFRNQRLGGLLIGWSANRDCKRGLAR